MNRARMCAKNSWPLGVLAVHLFFIAAPRPPRLRVPPLPFEQRIGTSPCCKDRRADIRPVAMRCDTSWHNVRLLTLAPGRLGLGAVERGAIAATDGRIVFAGAADDAPRFDAARRIDCEGRWISPGLIDCHT